MLSFTQQLSEKLPHSSPTDTELIPLISGTNNRRYGLIKRALATGQLISLRRGLYCLAEKYQKIPLNLFVLAQKIYGPSYISFQSALSHHGWIPEAVYTITSASFKRSRDFSTPLGLFSYTRVPAKIFLAGVRLVTAQEGNCYLATPIRALADYVLTYKKNWNGAYPLIHDLRIEDEELTSLQKEDLEELKNVFRSRRVQNFLRGLEKDLQL